MNWLNLKVCGVRKMSKSIITDLTEHCYVCGRYGTEIHHCLFGNNRKLADKYGLVVPLCAEHHRGNNGVHGNNIEIKEYLQKVGQRAYEENIGTREEFIKEFGKNYL